MALPICSANDPEYGLQYNPSVSDGDARNSGFASATAY
jgi:hypothetical protein